MLDWLWHFCMGWVEIEVDAACRSAFFAQLWETETPFWSEKERDGQCIVRIPKKCLDELQRQDCVPFHMCRVGGIPTFVHICSYRMGLVLGVCLFFLWCFYNAQHIWYVEIDGCVTLDEDVVRSILAEEGCGIGDYIPAIDCDALHANVKAHHPEIAWLSVYMHGNTAEVQLRETKFPLDPIHVENTYANCVAAEAGEIVSVRVFEGEAVVGEGDVVLPGELLISGVMHTQHEGENRLEYAAGEVLARVACPITVEVACTRAQKVYTGRQIERKSVKFLRKTINLFQNTGIPYATYDIIDTMEVLCLFGRYPLPVTICSTALRETEMRVETITPEDAVAEAMTKLRREMDKAMATGEMLHRSVTTTMTEDGIYRIDCLLYLLRNIAVTKEFAVQPPPVAS